MTERVRWCQFHQANHAYPLHCKVCGKDLPEGRYYNHVECKKTHKVIRMCPAHLERHMPIHCIACERPLADNSRSAFCSDCVSWEHYYQRKAEEKDKAKLAAWIEAQKP